MRVAIIGSGISGIATAAVLKRFGHEPELFERSERIGGIWAHAYPNVRLQNIASQYHLADFPWPFPPDPHPTAGQIHRYLRAAVEHFGLEVHCQHEVVAATDQGGSWQLDLRSPKGESSVAFPQIVVAAGQYSGDSTVAALPGRDDFRGEVITEREVEDLARFDGRRVAIVGFGKTAVDLASFAAQRADQVHHVFRTPRWLLPRRILGLQYTYPLFPRLGTGMIPSWCHSSAPERALHGPGSWIVRGFWKALSALFAAQRNAAGLRKGPEARRRLAAVAPQHDLVGDMRSALALAPEGYFRWVADGFIEPRRAAVSHFTTKGLGLGDGTEVPCDLVVLALGSKTPTFPYFEPGLRKLLEGWEDGVQLYRHLLHPRIPRVAFAGFNHGFLHVPAVEVAALWMCALWRGDLALPPVEAMERDIEQIRSWKRAHVNFEPSRSCAVNTRFQQYLDLLLRDLGLSPYRKLPNVFAEVFGRYGPNDYAALIEEYGRAHAHSSGARLPLPLAG